MVVVEMPCRLRLLRLQSQEGEPHAGRGGAEAPVRSEASDWIPALEIRVSTRSVPDAWRDYVYWTGEVESEEGGAN